MEISLHHHFRLCVSDPVGVEELGSEIRVRGCDASFLSFLFSCVLYGGPPKSIQLLY